MNCNESSPPIISVEDAQRIVCGVIPKARTETVNFWEAIDRVLAEDIYAPFAQPSFSNSAMDGYAVRSADIKNASKGNPAKLKVIGVIAAGQKHAYTITENTCVQIMTGAAIPDGADAVVRVEDTGGYVQDADAVIYKAAREGHNIRFAGEEVSAGALLLKKGTKISPSELGVIATFGFYDVPVFEQPKIALFASGDELREPGEQLKEGEIYNSNLHVLESLATAAGAEVVHSRVILDNKNMLRAFISQALQDCDVIVSSGGVSDGRFDYIRSVMEELKIDTKFSKVSQKPGQPLCFGTFEQKMIFGLPGNPVSTFICFMEYVYPAITCMTGGACPEKITATLAKPFPRDPKKRRYLFGQLWSEEGKLLCKPTDKHGSHMLTSALGANCIIEASAGESPLNEGEKVSVNLLPWSTILKGSQL